MISHQRVLAGAQPLEGDVEADGTFGYLWGVTVFVTIDGKPSAMSLELLSPFLNQHDFSLLPA